MILAFKHKHHDNDLTGHLISLWTGYDYTHAQIVFSDNMVGSSWKDGVQYKRFHDVIKNPSFFKFIEIDNSREKEVREFINSQLGKPFDWPGILLSQFLPLKIDDPRSWFCSEIVLTALQRAYPESFLNSFHPASISPGQLLKIIESKQYYV